MALLRFRDRDTFNQTVRDRVGSRFPDLVGHRRLGAARDWIAEYKAGNPDATAADVRAAAQKAKADGTIIAAIADLIVKIAPIVMELLKLFLHV